MTKRRSGVKALSGELAGWFRLRTGDYRLQFRVVPLELTWLNPQIHSEAFQNCRELPFGCVDQVFAADKGRGPLLNLLAAQLAFGRG